MVIPMHGITLHQPSKNSEQIHFSILLVGLSSIQKFSKPIISILASSIKGGIFQPGGSHGVYWNYRYLRYNWRSNSYWISKNICGKQWRYWGSGMREKLNVPNCRVSWGKLLH